MAEEHRNGNGNVFYKIEKLGHENYNAWSFKTKLLLMKEEVWDVIEPGVSPIPMTAAYRLREQKVLQIIAFSCHDNQLVHIKRCNGGKEAWAALKSHHQQSTVGARLRVQSQFLTLKMLPGGSVREHLDRIMELADQLGEMDEAVDEAFVCTKMLTSLPPEYEGLVTAIGAWTSDRLTIAAVKAKLVEEWEKKKFEQFDAGGAFRANTRDFPCHHCNDFGHYIRECPRLAGRSVSSYPSASSYGTPVSSSSSGPGTSRASRLTCFNCGGAGHIQRYCQQRINDEDLRVHLNRKRENKDDSESARMARYGSWYTCLLTNDERKGKGWFMDSGATSHMSACGELFTEMDQTFKGEVTVANGSQIRVMGRGKIDIIVSGLKVTLSDVLWVPDLDANLISVHKLEKKGFIVQFKNNKCYLLRGGDEMKIAQYDGKLYRLCENEKCFAATDIDEEVERCIHDWHRRLAHRNLRDIRLMRSEGLRIKDCTCNDDCESCLTDDDGFVFRFNGPIREDEDDGSFFNATENSNNQNESSPEHSPSSLSPDRDQNGSESSSSESSQSRVSQLRRSGRKRNVLHQSLNFDNVEDLDDENNDITYKVDHHGNEFEPKTFKQAVNSSSSELCLSAIEEELSSIKKKTWKLTDLPEGRKAIGSKWVSKLKLDENGKHREAQRTSICNRKFTTLQDRVKKGELKLLYHPTDINIADMMKKPLGSLGT